MSNTPDNPNTPPSIPPEDPELERYLDGESDLSEAWQSLPQAEPSAAIDQAIRAAAHAAPATDSSQDQPAAWHRWLKPLAAFAVAGVCLTITLQVIDLGGPQPSLSGTTEFNELEMTADSALNSRATAAKLRDNASPQEPVAPESPARLSRSAAPAAEESVLQHELLMAEDAYDSIAMPLFTETQLTAWREGARPSEATWQLAIEIARRRGDEALAVQETAKLALAYPEANDAAESAVQLESLQALPREQPTPQTEIIDASLWAATIQHIRNQGDGARAELEAEKFQRVYPEYVQE